MRSALAACGLALALAGCAMAPMGKPVPSMENIGKARAAGLPPMAVGSFALMAGKDPSLDRKVSIRTNTIYSPFESSFASYLKETLAGDLRAAGLLDPQSTIVIAGQLTDSQISVPAGEASATIAAHFTVTRAGAAVYAKELRARSTWKAEFNGFEALPMAINRYEQLYRQLTAALLEDPEFRAAVKR